MASCKLMKMYNSIRQRRSWRVLSPKFNFQLLTVVVVLALFFLILEPASALLLPQHPSEQASDPNSYLHLLGNTFHFRWKRTSWSPYGVGAAGRRVLLQAPGRFGRPSPMGYPPPGDNQHSIPHSPSFPGYRRGIP